MSEPDRDPKSLYVARQTGLSHQEITEAITEALRRQRESDAAVNHATPSRAKKPSEMSDLEIACEFVAWVDSGGKLEEPPHPRPYSSARALITLAARVRELEAINAAGAEAAEALEGIERRSAALLREALELYASAECVGSTREERKRVDELRAMVALPLLDYWPRTPDALHGAFVSLRDELIERDICLHCGTHTPAARTCQCENDE